MVPLQSQRHQKQFCEKSGSGYDIMKWAIWLKTKDINENTDWLMDPRMLDHLRDIYLDSKLLLEQAISQVRFGCLKEACVDQRLATDRPLTQLLPVASHWSYMDTCAVGQEVIWHVGKIWEMTFFESLRVKWDFFFFNPLIFCLLSNSDVSIYHRMFNNWQKNDEIEQICVWGDAYIWGAYRCTGGCTYIWGHIYVWGSVHITGGTQMYRKM